jgi:hypothetical protein
MTDDNQNELTPGDWNYTGPEAEREMTKIEGWISVTCLFGGLLISFWFIFVNLRPALGLLALGLGLAPVIYIGKNTRDIHRDQEDSQQSNQSQSDQVCTECGWQNPHSNNYCIDCGGELND